MLMEFDVRGQQRMDFVTGESVLWIFFARSEGLKLKGIILMFLLAFWTLILMAPIHCRWSIGEQVM